MSITITEFSMYTLNNECLLDNQQIFTSFKSTIETLEKGVKYVQS